MASVNFSRRTAMRLIMGLTVDELSKATGLSAGAIKLIESSSTSSKKNVEIYSKFMQELKKCFGDQVDKFEQLVSALQEVNAKSFTIEKRIDSATRRRFAMHLTGADICEKLKISHYQLSMIEQNKASYDEMRKKYIALLDEKYQNMYSGDQERVDLRDAAIKIANFPPKNPFRKKIEESGLLTTYTKFAVGHQQTHPEADLVRTESVDEMKEYIKLLEEENETLREKAKTADGTINELFEENDKLRKENESLIKKTATADSTVYKLTEENENLHKANTVLASDYLILKNERDELRSHLETRLTQPICGPTTLDTTVESIPGFHFENCTVTININKE